MGRRGPKPQSGDRERNGRLSRKPADIMDRVNQRLGKSEKDALRTGVDARVRLFGVDPRMSRDQMLGSFVGRLCIGKKITILQYDAALAYLEDWHANARAVQAPRQPAAINLDAVRGRRERPKMSKRRAGPLIGTGQLATRYRACRTVSGYPGHCLQLWTTASLRTVNSTTWWCGWVMRSMRLLSTTNWMRGQHEMVWGVAGSVARGA